jgi:hypothetical protein
MATLQTPETTAQQPDEFEGWDPASIPAPVPKEHRAATEAQASLEDIKNQLARLAYNTWRKTTVGIDEDFWPQLDSLAKAGWVAAMGAIIEQTKYEARSTKEALDELAQAAADHSNALEAQLDDANTHRLEMASLLDTATHENEMLKLKVQELQLAVDTAKLTPPPPPAPTAPGGSAEGQAPVPPTVDTTVKP